MSAQILVAGDAGGRMRAPDQLRLDPQAPRCERRPAFAVRRPLETLIAFEAGSALVGITLALGQRARRAVAHRDVVVGAALSPATSPQPGPPNRRSAVRTSPERKRT